MRILHINSVRNTGSTGRIVENIGLFLQDSGHDSIVAYGRKSPKSNLSSIKIGRELQIYRHGFRTLITDKHGFGSKNATRKLVKEIDNIKPDAIGLYNIHGYYINIEVLFDYLRTTQIPVLWTLFDCWAFTGHCSYFDDVACEKWKNHCQKWNIYVSIFRGGMVDPRGVESNHLFEVLQEWETHLAPYDLDDLRCGDEHLR